MLLFCLLCHNATLQQYRLPSVTKGVTKPSAERTSQNSVKPKFAEFTYQGDKRCTIAFLKMVADFSRGCAHQAMRPPISATHPHPTNAEEPEPHCWGSGSPSLNYRANVEGASV